MITRIHPARILLLATSVLTFAACSDDSGTGPDAAPNPVVLMKNEANVPITMVHIAKCSDDVWGENRLTGGQTIATGATRAFGITPGCWDVRASTGEKYGTWWDREVAVGDTVRLALSSAANSASSQALDPVKIRR